jgi:penicillin-binding protein 2
MQVTPIQMARATAALANGGRVLTPILREGEPQSETRVPVSEEVLQIVREGMRETVTEALATPLNFADLKVAVKTGTAETGTRNQYDNSWVVGFYPYENPQYAFAVVLERGPAGTGSQAVQVMRKFFEALRASGAGATTSTLP